MCRDRKRTTDPSRIETERQRKKREREAEGQRGRGREEEGERGRTAEKRSGESGGRDAAVEKYNLLDRERAREPDRHDEVRTRYTEGEGRREREKRWCCGP